jgi:Lrp/AsnC family transcriptional regulator for asnA, asnC and gidA
MKIDKINIRIIKELREGRKSFKAISEILNVTENTIRARVNRMTDEGILDICGRIDPAGIPGHKTVIIGIKLKEMDLVKKAEEISNLRGVISVSVVTGRYDLMVHVLLKTGFGLLEFYTDEISTVEGVGSVETFVVYKSFNMKVPYVL